MRFTFQVRERGEHAAERGDEGDAGLALHARDELRLALLAERVAGRGVREHDDLGPTMARSATFSERCAIWLRFLSSWPWCEPGMEPEAPCATMRVKCTDTSGVREQSSRPRPSGCPAARGSRCAPAFVLVPPI